MASTVIDLISHLETAMLDYNECQLWIFLESGEWKAFQAGCEDLMAYLEFSGHSLTASRVFQGFSEITAAIQLTDRDTWLQDCSYVRQKMDALLIRLKAISRSWNQLRPDPNIPLVPSTIQKQIKKTTTPCPDQAEAPVHLTTSTITKILNTAIVKLAEQPNIRIKKSKLPNSVRRPGPERVSLNQAKHRIKLLQDWADVQDRNKDCRMQRITLEQFAKSVSETPSRLKAHQAWYRKYRTHGDLPEDPRKVDPRKLAELFE